MSIINALTSVASSLLSGTTDVQTTDTLSYKSFLQNRLAWRQAGGPHSSDYNIYDYPTHNFYRILFHFENGDSDTSLEEGGMGNGLLHPTWLYTEEDWAEVMNKFNPSRAWDTDYWNFNTAWSYLKMNDEEERATYLREFITLLSNINTYSPWYFQNVKGIDEFVERKGMMDGKWDERGKITIETLDDSVDHRIGTLLDLYRASVWSHQHKRWVIPPNLRKFDMSIIVMSVPIQGIHTIEEDNIISDALGMVGDWLTTDSDENYASANPTRSVYTTSYKLFELHNCEIEYGTTKGGFSLDNAKGSGEKYNIEISFDDLYEVRYNEFMAQEIGDLVAVDSYVYEHNIVETDETTQTEYEQNLFGSTPDTYTGEKHDDLLEERLDTTSSSLVDQLLGTFTSKISTKVNSAILGNMYGTSIASSLNTGSALTQVTSFISNVTGTSYYNGLSIKDINNNIFGDSYSPSPSTISNNIFRTSTIMHS